LHVDPYHGCVHGCVYCYATGRSHHACDAGGKVSVVKPADMLKALGSSAGNEGEAIQHGMVLRLGVMGDPLQPLERVHRSTMAVLRWAERREHPVSLCSKGAPLLREYASLLARCHVQVSFSTLDADEASRLEPKAPAPAERLAAVEAVARAGGWVTARLAPFIPWLRSMREPDAVCRPFAAAGARHLLVEHLDPPDGKWDAISAAVGLPLRPFYSSKLGGAGHMPASGRLGALLAFREAALAAGMTFGCGDADMRLLNRSICCCGVDLALGRAVVNESLAYRIADAVRNDGECDKPEPAWLPSKVVNVKGPTIRRLARDCTPSGLWDAAWKWREFSQYGVRAGHDGCRVDWSAPRIGEVLRGCQALAHRFRGRPGQDDLPGDDAGRPLQDDAGSGAGGSDVNP